MWLRHAVEESKKIIDCFINKLFSPAMQGFFYVLLLWFVFLEFMNDTNHRMRPPNKMSFAFTIGDSPFTSCIFATCTFIYLRWCQSC